MNEARLIKFIVRNHKEIYYPLFAIIFTFILYWILSLFIEFADNHTIYPFLFFTFDLFLIKFTIDFYSELRDKKINCLSIILLYLSSIIILSIFTLVGLISLLFSDLFYLIPISIHFISIFIIYYFLHREVVKYYKKKEI